MLKRVLLLPLLSPVLATLVVGAINPKPPVTVRVLTWTSPALPLGLWLAGASCLGASLSAAGAALALQGGGPRTRSTLGWPQPRGGRTGSNRLGALPRDSEGPTGRQQ